MNGGEKLHADRLFYFRVVVGTSELPAMLESGCVASVHRAAPQGFDGTFYASFDAYYNQGSKTIRNNATRVGDQAPLYLFQKCMANAGFPLK